MVRVNEIVRRKIRRWEEQNIVYGAGYVDKTKGSGKSLGANMQTRGYDAMRVSPRITVKFGLKYRKVFGTQVVPNHSRSNSFGSKEKKFFPLVKWHHQGFIKATKKSGSFVLNRSIFREFQNSPLKTFLMLRR